MIFYVNFELGPFDDPPTPYNPLVTSGIGIRGAATSNVAVIMSDNISLSPCIDGVLAPGGEQPNIHSYASHTPHTHQLPVMALTENEMRKGHSDESKCWQGIIHSDSSNRRVSTTSTTDTEISGAAPIQRPTRHENSTNKIRDWSIDINKQIVIIGAWNLSRISQYNTP